MKNRSLYDTGFLFALFDENDAHHEVCTQALPLVVRTAILPDVVIPELSYLILRELDVESLVKFLRRVVDNDFDVERTTNGDLERAAEILERYDDNNIDLVDAVIVAMAERLNITRILTVDRRHFAAFKPQHCEAFEILP